MDLVITKPCGRCEGTGTDKNVNPVATCTNCSGTGKVENSRIDITDIMSDLDKCKKRLKKIMDAMGLSD